jgi:pimeloyl-ACP methyl ester carboxylesterase
MGGMVISRAAEMEPALFAGLIYVCAFLPRAGDSLLSLGGEITGSQVPSVMKRHTLAGVTTIDGARAKPVFYGDCIDEDAAACAARLVPQSLPPFLARIRVSRDAFGLSRRFYIACTRDNAIPMALQERMIERVGVEDHVSFDTSHSPFLSRPDDTADQIRAFAQRL